MRDSVDAPSFHIRGVHGRTRLQNEDITALPPDVRRRLCPAVDVPSKCWGLRPQWRHGIRPLGLSPNEWQSPRIFPSLAARPAAPHIRRRNLTCEPKPFDT